MLWCPGLLHAQTPRQVLAKLAVHSVSQSEDALLDLSAIAAQDEKHKHIDRQASPCVLVRKYSAANTWRRDRLRQHIVPAKCSWQGSRNLRAGCEHDCVCVGDTNSMGSGFSHWSCHQTSRRGCQARAWAARGMSTISLSRLGKLMNCTPPPTSMPCQVTPSLSSSLSLRAT